MGISAAIHLVLIVLISLVLTGNIDPAAIDRVLVVKIEPIAAGDRVVADPLIADDSGGGGAPVERESAVSPEASEAAVLIPESKTYATRSKERPIDNDPERDDVRGANATVLETDSLGAASEFIDEADTSAHPGLRIVTSVAPAAQTLAAGVAQTELLVPALKPMSDRQEKMLVKKFREWTENFHKDRDAGLSWQHGGQEYFASFKQRPAPDSMGRDQVIVEITTEENGRPLSTEMRMNRLTFSNFAQFVHRWDPEISIHNDELDGRFHSNSKINLAYTRDIRPKFHGKVTTSSRGVDVVDSRGFVDRDEIFLGGLETGVKRIALPKRAIPFVGDSVPEDGDVQYFDADARITFYANGTYGWQATESDEPEQIRPLAAATAFLVGGRKVKLHVSGTVKGRVLVYSPERILIEGDLRYARDPALDAAANDYLGLVSDRYVEVAKRAVTGPGDLNIYASIYAGRRFAVRGYRKKENAMLYIYGSLTAGSLSATEPRYHTKIQFDKRLETLRAPGFPMTNRYEVESWNGVWRADDTGT